MPAKAEGFRQDGPWGGGAGCAGDEVDVALGIGVVVVLGRGDEAVADGLHGGDGRDGSGRSHEVTDGGLDRSDGDVVEVRTEHGAERVGFGGVVADGGGAVGVDVLDVARGQVRVVEGLADGTDGTGAVGCGVCRVSGVGGRG